MRKENCKRKVCQKILNAFLFKLVKYAGVFEFPVIWPTYEIPDKLISFSKCISSKDYDAWVHFYEDDYLFERIWRHPKKYLTILKRFKGVILVDFSVYRDMPLIMQLWNIFRSRAIGHWLQINGIKVIPNIRFGDERTYNVCCDGISPRCVIAVGTHGTIKNRIDRIFFERGLECIVKRLDPVAIIVYGSAPKQIFDRYIDQGIRIYQFDSEFAISRKGVV